MSEDKEQLDKWDSVNAIEELSLEECRKKLRKTGEYVLPIVKKFYGVEKKEGPNDKCTKCYSRLTVALIHNKFTLWCEKCETVEYIDK